MSMFPILAVESLIVTLIPALVLMWKYDRHLQSSGVLRLGFGGGAIITATILLAFCSGIMFPSLVPISMVAVASICSLARVPFWPAIRWTVSTGLIIDFGFLCWWGSVVWHFNEQLRQHPVISLLDRLDYEQDARAISDFNFTEWVNIEAVPEQPLSDLPTARHFNRDQMHHFEQEIAREAQRTRANLRKRMLRTLLQAHRDASLQFAQTLGLGVGRARVIPFRSWQLDLPETSPFSLPSADACVNDSIDDYSVESTDANFQSWHEQNLIQFARPVTLGLVDWDRERKRPDLSRVVGFRSHAFSSRPEALTGTDADDGAWQVSALALMSLLKHQSPVVYVTTDLPDLQALTEAPTRQLDDFEANSLDQLISGEELVVRCGLTQIRMVGAIRAAAQCLECHQVPRGKLLGAFCYRLKRQAD